MSSNLMSLSSFPPKSPSIEDHYSLLIDSITDYAIFLLDPTGHIATWNKGAQLIKQYEAEEIIGKHYSVFYTEEAKTQEEPVNQLQVAISQGKYEGEGWRLRKDGTAFWANVTITPVYDQEKALVGFSKVTRDLSERKKRETDLLKAYEEQKKSEEKYRLLVERVTDYAIFMLDPSGHIVTWNEGAKKMKGYEVQEILGKHFSQFYSHAAVQNGYPEYELEMARANGHFEDEGWRYRKDGSQFWANVIITTIYNYEKQFIGYSKITRDLTEKKQMQEQLFRVNEELKESEERTRLLIEGVKDYAIFMLNPEGLISTWNAGAERIKGYQASEILGKHFSSFYSREAVESGYPDFELKKALENGSFEDEGWRIRKDGTAFWANVVITPIHNTANRLLGFTKVTRDLTERRRNEELLRKNNQELGRVNKDLENFVYTASHDLKTPILNLEGLLTALQEDLGSEIVKHGQLLTMMQGAVLNLKKVIMDLADVTRLQKEKEEPEKVNIKDLLEEVQESLRELIITRKAEIIVEAVAFEWLIYSRKNLRSILYNLLLNAIKYAHPQRTPHVIIKTRFSLSGDYILSVADNGLGIAANKIGKIFSLFNRAHSHVEGTGIGLFLVKRILDNSGDRIAVESEVGKGTIFNVYFKREES